MFNNPYYMYPYMNQAAIGGARIGTAIPKTAAKGGFLKAISGIKWGAILNNTQKTLNVINQAIPVYYQIKPIYNNLKSFGKIMSAFNEPNSTSNQNNTRNYQEKKEENIEKKENSNLPTFFIN